MSRRSPDDWRGYIAFVMSLGVAIGFGTALILSASGRTPPISQDTATLLSTLGGAMIGAIATYLGMGRGPREPRDGDDSGEGDDGAPERRDGKDGGVGTDGRG
jgi:hypothetical protein